MSRIEIPTLNKIVQYIENDFTNLWNALKNIEGTEGRANFVFGTMTCTFLELITRFTYDNAQVFSGFTADELMFNFSTELSKRFSRYFSKIENLKIKYTGGNIESIPNFIKETPKAYLPFINKENNYLLHLIFHAIRHGQVHTFNQQYYQFENTNFFSIGLTGVGANALDVTKYAVPNDHCKLLEFDNGYILKVYPDRLFNDLLVAFKNSKLINFSHHSSTIFQKEFVFENNSSLQKSLGFSADDIVDMKETT